MFVMVDEAHRTALDRLTERVDLWSPRTGGDPAAVLIRDQKKRWASCDTKGNLRFNWRIIQAPMRLVDYVVAHELVHLRHKEHDKAFWSALGRAMPDYDDRRETLRRTGAKWQW